MRAKDLSVVAIIGGITAFGFMALAAILFVQPGGDGEGLQRIGLFFAIVSSVVVSLVAMLKADMAANQTNGKLDDRIRDSVYQAMATRRSTDIVPPEARDDIPR